MAKSSKEKPVIAVLTGGTASELGISLKSAEIVYDNIPKSRFRVYKVLLKNGREWEVYQGDKRVGDVDKNDFSLLVGGQRLPVEAAFVALHGTPAEDGRIQGYLDLMGVPYTTSGVWTSAVSFSKDTTKQVLRQTGVPLARSCTVFSWDSSADRKEKLDALTMPVFVKPNKNGSSYGISKVHTREDLRDAMEKAFEFDDEVMVEEYVKGVEITCGVMRHKGELIALPLTEIRTSREFFDYEAKYLGASEEITPAEISESDTLSCQELSRKLYMRLDCKGIARFDYILSEGKFYFLEVNTVPGLTSESIVPQQARAYGWSLEELFVNCLEEVMR